MYDGMPNSGAQCVYCGLLAGTRGATEVSDGAERNAVGLQGGGWGVWCALWLAGTRGATEVSDGAERNAVGLQGGGWGVCCALWLADTRGATECRRSGARFVWAVCVADK